MNGVRHPGFFRRYAVAVAFALLATVLTALFWPWIQPSRYLFFWPAIIFAASGGLGPGLLATGLSIFLVDFFFLKPVGAVFVHTADIVQFSVFAFVAAIISLLENRRQRAMISAQDARKEMDIILENVADAITVQMDDGSVVYANQAAVRMTGMPSKQVMLETPMAEARQRYEMLDDHDHLLTAQELPRTTVFSRKVPAEIRFRMRLLETNEERWIHLRSAPVFDQHGNVRLAVNVFRDISERQHYEQRLRKHQQHLQRVLDSLYVFVGVMTIDGILIEANLTSLNAANLSPQEVLNKPFDQTYWWSYSERVQEQLRAAIQRAAQGDQVRYDVKMRVANEQFITVDFMLTPMRDERGAIIFLVPSGVDISQRVQIENERTRLLLLLEMQRQRLSNIIANVPAIIWEGRGSPEGGQSVDFISVYAETMLGYPVQDWQKPNFWEQIVHPDDRAAALREAQRIFESGSPGRMQFRCVAKDGRIVPVEAYTSIVQDDSATRSSVCGVVMDITKRKQAEEAIARYAEELRRSNQELQQFAYVASHDLQEPLRMIASYLQLLQQRYGNRLDSDATEFIEFAVDGAARMKKLINDLLAYSRLQNRELDVKQFETADALGTAIRNLKVAIDNSVAEITCDTLPALVGDENRVVQLFQNLLSNAIKYRKEGDTPLIHVSAQQQGHEWVFSVRDNGIGIENKYANRIFVIFQRLHTKSAYSGTGIGLAICKRIVDSMNGRIWVESEPDVGSTFFFALPATLSLVNRGEAYPNGSDHNLAY